jgi:hypothetical protein
MKITPIIKSFPWSNYTNSTPIEDVDNTRSTATLFSVLMITTDSYRLLLGHPDILYHGRRQLESIFDVDCVVKHHEDCILELEVHTMYMHTGTRRFLDSTLN